MSERQKKQRTFSVWHCERPEWAEDVTAESASGARYKKYMDYRDAGYEVRFIDFMSRVIGPARLSAKELETERNRLIVENWNLQHRLGARVIVTLDSGEERETVTTHEATLLCGHTPVAWLAGISGCYALDRVRGV